ncbi:hypothetical protein BDK51DRAFT_31006 [Blyttiomyces helicus]|uniref:SH3 domain-containing protein n=1 Tax=Blyttiomyces helicus TaxID=388810 RepID=A0A4P9WRP9_9FUNG|nr:hypothetical protein BDK51DRAFT_31006 [Blyttiomyces helicus]|eukprot:RKO93606.1 hypothetical protein BDK51DRAFT_31006 [Blyttiomyces helicus]
MPRDFPTRRGAALAASLLLLVDAVYTAVLAGRVSISVFGGHDGVVNWYGRSVQVARIAYAVFAISSLLTSLAGIITLLTPRRRLPIPLLPALATTSTLISLAFLSGVVYARFNHTSVSTSLALAISAIATAVSFLLIFTPLDEGRKYKPAMQDGGPTATFIEPAMRPATYIGPSALEAGELIVIPETSVAAAVPVELAAAYKSSDDPTTRSHWEDPYSVHDDTSSGGNPPHVSSFRDSALTLVHHDAASLHEYMPWPPRLPTANTPEPARSTTPLSLDVYYHPHPNGAEGDDSSVEREPVGGIGVAEGGTEPAPRPYRADPIFLPDDAVPHHEPSLHDSIFSPVHDQFVTRPAHPHQLPMANLPRMAEPALPRVESARHHPYPDPATTVFEPRVEFDADHTIGQKPQRGSLPCPMVLRGIAQFYPRNSDEVEVQLDDRIVLRKAFSDGWVLIANLTRKTEGFAPEMAIGFRPASVVSAEVDAL